MTHKKILQSALQNFIIIFLQQTVHFFFQLILKQGLIGILSTISYKKNNLFFVRCNQPFTNFENRIQDVQMSTSKATYLINEHIYKYHIWQSYAE
jgi:hypothetical protein